MDDHPRFGPAGIPPSFKAIKAALTDIPRLLREEGLDAFEYQAVRWGTKPQIRKNEAEKLGVKAKENDVMLSLHGSYFINLCSGKETVEASKDRLIACATASQWMGSKIVVFHPGFYGRKPPTIVFQECLRALKDVVEKLKVLGIRDVKLGPETMGKQSQFGSLEEILALCEQADQTQPVIDWAHLHARDCGRFRSIDDFRVVIEKIERRLGSDAIKNMHCHFTKVEFTDKGEKCHHTMDEIGYGPEFEILAKVIIDFKLAPILISESPLLDVDAVKMRDILQKEMK